LQTNGLNRVENVAGVSASDDDLQIFGGSTGNAALLLAVTLYYCVSLQTKKDTNLLFHQGYTDDAVYCAGEEDEVCRETI